MKDGSPLGQRDDLLAEIADYVLPILKPYQLSLYLYLLRRSQVAGHPFVRVGKRTIGVGLGKSTRSSQSNYQHIGEQLNGLAELGFLVIGDVTREGTLYEVRLPRAVPAVRELLAVSADTAPESVDHYHSPELRRALFERDHWTCHYCAEVVNESNATLDHLVPVSGLGDNSPSNLVTACLECNSIKSGRTYEEAAAGILASVRRRRLAGGTTLDPDLI